MDKPFSCIGNRGGVHVYDAVKVLLMSHVFLMYQGKCRKNDGTLGCGFGFSSTFL